MYVVWASDNVGEVVLIDGEDVGAIVTSSSMMGVGGDVGAIVTSSSMMVGGDVGAIVTSSSMMGVGEVVRIEGEDVVWVTSPPSDNIGEEVGMYVPSVVVTDGEEVGAIDVGVEVVVVTDGEEAGAIDVGVEVTSPSLPSEGEGEGERQRQSHGFATDGGEEVGVHRLGKLDVEAVPFPPVHISVSFIPAIVSG
jgi:hypothetical protein